MTGSVLDVSPNDAGSDTSGVVAVISSQSRFELPEADFNSRSGFVPGTETRLWLLSLPKQNAPFGLRVPSRRTAGP